MRRSPHVVFMLGQRRRRCHSIETTLGECLLFAGIVYLIGKNVCRRQIQTSKVDLRTVRVKIFIISDNGRRPLKYNVLK